MKKIIFLVLGVLFFVGCYRTTHDYSYGAPNWTSDNKIVFIEVHREIRHYKEITGERTVVVKRECYLWEVDLNQNYRKIAKIADDDPGITNTSSAGEWVVLGCSYWGENGEIWVIKRDGTNFRKVTNGKYPDFSPDAKKIVFTRDDGLYVINRDGNGIKRIVNDSNATHPAWSSDGGRIAYVRNYPNVTSLEVVDTAGNPLKSFQIEIDWPDWGPADSNAISGSNGYNGEIIYYESEVIDTLKGISLGWGGGLKWSPTGDLFLAYRTVYKRNGTKVLFIKP